jgi:tyrosinase
MAITQPTGPVLESLEAGAPTERYLNIENITGEGEPKSYRVYVNVPAGDDAESHPELLAGTLPMFGLQESSRASERHAGNGLHYVLRVGDIVKRLQARNDWDDAAVRLTFVPVRRGEEAPSPLESNEAASPIRVGRISLHVA